MNKGGEREKEQTKEGIKKWGQGKEQWKEGRKEAMQ
jgi:hypothetical protein